MKALRKEIRIVVTIEPKIETENLSKEQVAEKLYDAILNEITEYLVEDEKFEENVMISLEDADGLEETGGFEEIGDVMIAVERFP